jgi:hypothetical protein
MSGADTLLGGAGDDRITGGSDNDVFVFAAVSETGKTATSRDVITDFTQGEDVIDLSAIDANTLLVGDKRLHLPRYGRRILPAPPATKLSSSATSTATAFPTSRSN